MNEYQINYSEWKKSDPPATQKTKEVHSEEFHLYKILGKVN